MITPPHVNKSLNYAAILFAVSMPTIILGRTAVAVPLVMAFLLVTLSSERKQIFQQSASALRSPITVAMAVVAIIWVMGLLNSFDAWRSLTTGLRSILYIVLMLPMWAAVVQSEHRVELCFKTLAISSLVLGLVAIIALHMPSSFIGTLRGNPGTPLDPVRILKESASSAALMIPLLVWFVWNHSARWRLIGFLAIVAMIAIIFLTGSRSAFAGLVGSIAVVAIVYNLHRRNLKILLTSCLVGAVFAGLTAYWIYETRSSYIGSYGDVAWPLPEWLIDPPRQAIWKFAWEAGEPHRWIGVGINAIDKLPGASNWNLGTGTRNIPLHPHNWAVEIAIETGSLGFLGFFCILALFSVKHIRRYMRSGSPALLALSGVWGAYWVSGLFSFSYWSSWWQISFLVATVICLTGDAWHQKSSENTV